MMYGSGREYTPYRAIPSVVVSLKYDKRAALPVSFTSGCYGHPHMLRRKERDTKQKPTSQDWSFPCLERCTSSGVISSQAQLLHKGKKLIGREHRCIEVSIPQGV
ncbi:hypothetical protein QQF64_032353 [Cirrhinus molitorella]|uniref:Uncharacterized protein n=1 Tax=Cirrhinus molitorella TaxID=172907 RepID=A0ABR3MZK6_9TELE